jgi:hypothetical protein
VRKVPASPHVQQKLPDLETGLVTLGIEGPIYSMPAHSYAAANAEAVGRYGRYSRYVASYTAAQHGFDKPPCTPTVFELS